MAVEDGQMMEFTPDMFRMLIESRRASFAEMMDSLPGKGYTYRILIRTF